MIKFENSTIIKLIEDFCKSFDTKNWELMNNCLNAELVTDYESFRGTPKQNISSIKYIKKRKIGLKTLNTEHKTTEYLITKSTNEIKCHCKFEIRRFDLNSDKFLHSFGEYEFDLIEVNQALKIYKIKQTVKEIEGDKSIHGAFREIKSDN